MLVSPVGVRRAACLAWLVWIAALPAYADGGGTSSVSPVIPTTPMQDAVGANGLRLSDNARLHPYAWADLHWVTNPGLLPPNANPTSDLMLLARLGVDGYWGHSTWDSNYLLEVRYNEYFGVEKTGSSNLSGFSGHAGVNAVFNKDSDFVIRLNVDESRVNDVGNQTFTERLLHWITQASLGADIRPGSGALVLTPAFMFFYDKYDAIAHLPSGILDNWRYMPSFRLAWQFLPKTSLFVDASAQLARFNTVVFVNAVNPALTDPNSVNVNSNIASFSAGLSGQLTTRVSALLQAGYTNTFTESGGDNLQTATGAAILTYGGETVKVSGGYLRTMQPASLFRYFTLNRVYLKFDQQLTTRTVVSLGPEFNYLAYANEVTPQGSPRVDNDYVFQAVINQALSEWWTLAITERVNYRTSTFSSALGTTGYFFNDVYISLRLRY